MRGTNQQQFFMFSYISAERRVSKEDQLRAIREMADAALAWGAASTRFAPSGCSLARAWSKIDH
jgi:hypothetical protein